MRKEELVMKKTMHCLFVVISLFLMLLPTTALAASRIISSDATDIVEGAGTRVRPWILTVGNEYTIFTDKILGSNECLDANWYVKGNSANYIEICGQNYDTVTPKIKAISASNDQLVILTLERQMAEPGLYLGLLTGSEYYFFKVEGAGENIPEPEEFAEPERPTVPETSTAPETPTVPIKPADASINDENSGSGTGGSSSASEIGGSCGVSAKWRLDGNVLTISGSGVMFFKAEDNPWEEYKSDIKTVKIEDGITNIYISAFEGCENLESVLISDSVTSIGNSAFAGCESLESVIIPSSVISIGFSAFEGCVSLENITLSSNLEKVESSMFEGCESLKSLEILGSVTSIGNSAFAGCENLKSVLIPNSVTTIGGLAFDKCVSLEHITLPSKLELLDSFVFSGCMNLKSIAVPENVKTLEVGVFRNCSSLESISIPQSLQRIEIAAFDGCIGLKDVYYNGTRAQWDGIYIDSNNEALGSATLHVSNYTGGSAASSTTLSSSADSGKTNGTVSSNQSIHSTLSRLHTGQWYEDFMEWAQSNSITDDADYKNPNGNCSRASIVLYLWRVKGCPSPSGAGSFNDLSSGTDYYGAVQWAVENGIVSGFEDGSFRPADMVTRAEAVAILYRYSGMNKASSNITFVDVPKGAWYEEQVKWAVENSITSGTGDNCFSPNDTCTIAQILAFLYRMIGK